MPLEQNRLDLATLLSKYFEEWDGEDVYRYIFPSGSLQESYDMAGVPGDGKGNMLVTELIPLSDKEKQEQKKAYKGHVHIINDDMFRIDEVLECENFCITSLISYIGRSRSKANAKDIYGIIIDLDGVHTESQFRDVIHQHVAMKDDKYRFIPVPTFFISSGSGIHIYYVFETPLVLYPNVIEKLEKMKSELTRKIWNAYVTDYSDDVQYQSIFQGFRVIGTTTKYNDKTRAFKVGDKLTIEDMNKYVTEKSQIDTTAYKSDLPLSEAKAKYPEWYQRRVVENDKSIKRWKIEEKVHGQDPLALYHWWLERIKKEATVGHRYHCLNYLVAYGKKCGMTKEEIEKDAVAITDLFETRTTEEDNHFTLYDLYSALQTYDNQLSITYKVDIISKKTDIPIEKNRRNGRKQKLHLKIARATRDIIYDNWREGNGRKPKKEIIKEYMMAHPNETNKSKIARELNITRQTVIKWYNQIKEELKL